MSGLRPLASDRTYRALLYPLWCLVMGGLGCESPSSGRDQFVKHVIPVLEARCSAPACHGVVAGAEAGGDVVDWSLFFLHTDDKGRITDKDAAYDAALRIINTVEGPEFSTLLRKALPVTYGGLPHFGKDNFASPNDDGYRTVYDWIASETQGGEDPAPLDGLVAVFAETVQSHLIGTMCANANCHGPSAGIPFRLEGGLGGKIPVAATRLNYEEARKMLAVDGDPRLSRLIRKGSPLHAGGILHKGGNTSFFTGPNDPRVQAIAKWACLEREEATGVGCPSGDEPPIEGFVYVKGPVSPRGFFDLDAFAVGSDLFMARTPDATLAPESVVNLTAGLHSELADVRDPAVHHDGSRVAFAMRLSEDQGHHIWEIELSTGEARQLTSGGGALPGGGFGTDRDPTYGPDGRIWFVSTRAGRVADGGTLLDADIYALEPESGAVERWSWTPHIERKPVFLVTGEAAGEVSFTSLRRVFGSAARAHPFRFPPSLKTEYHQHFGITPTKTLFADMRELPDGRNIAVVGDLTAVWGTADLAVIDRNFGPEINELSLASDPSLPAYADPVAQLHSAEGPGLYRDPVPLPDGRLLAAFAPGRLDPSDATAQPVFRIVAIELGEGVDGTGAVIKSQVVLVEDEDASVRDPEPIFVRAPAPTSDEQLWDPNAEHGLLRHSGLPMIDALLSNLSPSGSKVARNDIVAVRVVEALQPTPNQWKAIPESETMDGAEAATNLGLGDVSPARVLCELPLAEDGTFHAALPPGVGFRLQGLDARGMAVGVMHNRWFDLHPGQVLPQGVSAKDSAVYTMRCAPCHGSVDGSPQEVFVAPDVITTASLTMSRYANQNPRRPIEPPVCGDASRIAVDFMADVQPILDRSCAVSGCHSGPEAPAGLDLRGEPTEWFAASYERLLVLGEGSGGGRRYVDATTGSAWRSFLMEKLLGSELAAPRELDSAGSPHPQASAAASAGAATLTEDDIRIIARWIDLGANFKAGVEGAD